MFSPFSGFKYGQDMLVKITILGNNLSIFLFMPRIINIFLPLSCFEYVTMHPVQSRREKTFIRYWRTRWRVYATGGWKERALSCTETGKGTRREARHAFEPRIQGADRKCESKETEVEEKGRCLDVVALSRGCRSCHRTRRRDTCRGPA